MGRMCARWRRSSTAPTAFRWWLRRAGTSQPRRTWVDGHNPSVAVDPRTEERRSPMSDDLEEIRQLKARYFRMMDTKNWEGLAAVFTDDVEIDVTGEGGGVTHS